MVQKIVTLYIYCSNLLLFIHGDFYSVHDNSASVLNTDEIQSRIPNHTEIFNHHLIPYVIDEMPYQTCGMLFIHYSYYDFKYHRTAEFDAHLGVTLKPSDTRNPPFFEWYDADETDYYTAMIFDIDSPSVNKPIHRDWLHFLAVNSRGYIGMKRADVLVDYIGPWPLKHSGKHRYVGVVYMQPKRMLFKERHIYNSDFISRRNFSHREFAKKYNLGKPICVNFFTAEWETYVDTTFKKYLHRM
ncbi:protein D3-like [Lycorma delicatula]|uniref:protein D3-like n=2 Tax=Lycorma delicatula TaxID=130591 RepID=UPI003F50DD76